VSAVQLALDINHDRTIVHCPVCTHIVAASTPDLAHGEMETHYDTEHALYIRMVTR